MARGEPQGFIALFTAVMFGAIIMAVALTVSTTSFFTRGGVLDAEYKEQSRALAEACVEIARVKIAENASYAGPDTVLARGGSCTVDGVQCDFGTGLCAIAASARFPDDARGAVTRLSVGMKFSDFSIATWQEIP